MSQVREGKGQVEGSRDLRDCLTGDCSWQGYLGNEVTVKARPRMQGTGSSGVAKQLPESPRENARDGAMPISI